MFENTTVGREEKLVREEVGAGIERACVQRVIPSHWFLKYTHSPRRAIRRGSLKTT
jgi:hypothetical protein